jgi:hypothetical protein
LLLAAISCATATRTISRQAEGLNSVPVDAFAQKEGKLMSTSKSVAMARLVLIMLGYRREA